MPGTGVARGRCPRPRDRQRRTPHRHLPGRTSSPRQRCRGAASDPAGAAEIGPVGVDQPRAGFERRLRCRHRFDRLDLELDRSECGLGDPRSVGHDRRQRFAFVRDVVGGEQRHVEHDDAGALVWHVGSGHHSVHAVDRRGCGRVDADEPAGRHGRPEQLRVEHPGKHDVDTESGCAAHLRLAVAADGARADRRCHRFTSPPAAATTASIIWR